jgi:hypothetical protein
MTVAASFGLQFWIRAEDEATSDRLSSCDRVGSVHGWRRCTGKRDVKPAPDRKLEDVMDINIDEMLWASGIMPEGMVERWFVSDGTIVAFGDRLAAVRIEDALHEIIAPANGRLSIVVATNGMVEPGSLLARLAS